MKYRQGFVSNSSSASFVVPKHLLSLAEIKAFLDYNYSEDNTDAWLITETKDSLKGYTNMDNDALDDFLDRIGFDFSKMQWRGDN